MSEIIVRRYSPRLSSPLYIVGLSGPNELGRITARRLVDRSKANLFIEFYNQHFPDHVVVTEDGTCRLLRYEIYESALTSPNLIIACGDPEISLENVGGGYEALDELVMLGRSHGASNLILVDAAPMADDGSIYTAATKMGLARSLERKGAKLIRDARLPGPAGAILGICRLYRLNAVGIFPTLAKPDDAGSTADACLRLIETQFGLSYPSQRSM